MAAARYVELNPVRARLAAKTEDWPWSSARAHLKGRDDDLVTAAAPLERESDWRAFLHKNLSEGEYQALRSGERTGRPLGWTRSWPRWNATSAARWRDGSRAQNRRSTIGGDRYCVPLSVRKWSDHWSV